MKNINLLVLIFLLMISWSCGNNSTPKKAEPPKPQIAEIKFESEKIDVGIVDGKTNVNADFKFRNTGNIPLVINEVRGSCHCVQGTKPDKPIAPGDSSVISLSFDPVGQSGSNMRTMMVYSNASRPEVQLYILCDIHRDPKEKVVKSSH